MCCLFCDGAEKAYTPSKNVDFVCSTCVQILKDANQCELQQALKRAEQLGLTRKVTALRMFVEEENDEQRKPKPRKHERHFNRKRIDRPFRDQKIPLR